MPPEERLAALRELYAELHREIARQARLEEALERAREMVAKNHEERASTLAPYALAYEPHGEAYLDEVEGRFAGGAE